MLERFGPLARKGLPLVLAVLVPLAGVVLALLSYQQGEHEDARNLAIATVLGLALYGIFIF